MGIDEVWPLKGRRIPNEDLPAESATGLDQLLAATPAEYGMPVRDREDIYETDVAN